MNPKIAAHFRPLHPGPSLVSRLPGLVRLVGDPALEKNRRPIPKKPARSERRPRSKTRTPPQPRVSYKFTEWADMIGVTRKTVHQHVKDGLLRTVRVGRRRMIPASELRRLKLVVEPEK
jgi:excisionase family DNA binding protein